MLLCPMLSLGQLPASCNALAKKLRADTALAPVPVLPRPCTLRAGCIQVDWAMAQQQDLDATFKLARITEKTPVVLRVLNVNALAYMVAWTTEVTPPSPAFEAVAALFEPIAPVLGLLGQSRGQQHASDEVFLTWVSILELSEVCVDETLMRWRGPVVDSTGDQGRRTLSRVGKVLSKAMDSASVLRLAFLANGKFDEHEAYLSVKHAHQVLLDRITDLQPRIEKAAGGSDVVIGTRERNSAVTLQGVMTDKAGKSVGSPVVARYFVKWSRPVLYHVGYGVGRLRSYSFEKVRSLTGQDLFALTAAGGDSAGSKSDDREGPEAIAFMHYELKSMDADARFGAGLSLGTGLMNPGRSVYAGASLRILSRGFITLGAVAATAVRGDGATTDVTGNTKRVLYTALKEKGAIKPFWSLSLRVY